MDDRDIGRLIGLLIAAAALWGAWTWASANWGRISRTTTSWWSSWSWMLWAASALLVVLLVVRAWAGRRRRRRAAQRESLAEEITRLMPSDWDAKTGLWIRSWRGTSPGIVQIQASLATSTSDLELRRGLQQVLVSRMGPVRLTWPGDDHKSRRKTRWIKAVADTREAASRETGGEDTGVIVRSSLVGLVPTPKVELHDDGVIEIAYGETTRDQSEVWRARVVEQVSARTDSRYRATWDRAKRSVQLAPVPELPAVIEWMNAIQRFRALGLPERWIPYGIDEDGNWVVWEIGPAAPHTIGAGKTGAGKSELTKAVIQAWLLMGGLVAIIDPKRQDFAEFRGRPGVLAVATDLHDRLGLLKALRAEMFRRNAAAELRKLMVDNPDLAGDVPPVSAKQTQLDQVRILLVVDELTQHRKDTEAWLRSLSREEKALQSDVLGIPGEIAQLARAVSMHEWVSMQRNDADNFGDSTQMRDNLPHVTSMGQLSAIGSEMAWGDRYTGRTVVISGPGEGMSNGRRISPTGEPLQIGVAGRFKAFYSATDARRPEFWAEVAKVVPDASRIDLGEVSAAARDVRAAIAALRVVAYGHDADGHESDDQEPVATVTHDEIADKPSQAAPPIPPVSPQTDDGGDDNGATATDLTGRTWEQVRVTDLEVGDVVSLGDLDAVEVVHVAGWSYDEFNGDRVFGITISDGGDEQVLDLSDEEALLRLV